MIDTTRLSPDAVQANYWSGALSRAEGQKVFEEFGGAITDLRQFAQNVIVKIGQLELTAGFLMEKVGATPEEFQAFVAQKVEEIKAALLLLLRARKAQHPLRPPWW